MLSPYDDHRIRKFYEGLTTDQQYLLKLYIVLNQEISGICLTNRLRETNVVRPSGKPYSGQDVKVLFALIKDSKVGSDQPGRSLRVSRELSSWVGARASEEGSFVSCAKAILPEDSERLRFRRPYWASNFEEMVLCQAYYWDGDAAALQKLLVRKSKFSDSRYQDLSLLKFVHYPFCARRFECLPELYRSALIPEIHEMQSFFLSYYPAWTEYLRGLADPKYQCMLGDMLLLSGDFEGASKIADRLCGMKPKARQVEGAFLKGVIAFLLGDQAEAARCIEQGLKMKGATFRVSLLTEAFVALFLLSREEPIFKNALAYMTPKKRSSEIASVLKYLQERSQRQPGQERVSFNVYHRDIVISLSAVGRLLTLHAWIWGGVDFSVTMEMVVGVVIERSLQQEAPLIGVIAANILRHFNVADIPDIPASRLPQISEILPLKKELSAWEKRLVELECFAMSRHPQKLAALPSVEKASRLVWELVTSKFDDSVVEVVPKEQVATKQGGWTRGRSVSLARLREGATRLPFVAPEDLPVIECIFPSMWYSGQCELSCASALYRLVGHPGVYREGMGDVPIEIAEHSLKFILSDEPSGDITLTVQPSVAGVDFGENGIVVWWETPTRLSVMAVSQDERHIVNMLKLASGPLRIPSEGKERLIQVIQAFKDDVHVFTDVEAAGDASVQVIEPNLKLQLHLAPHGEGLRAALRVQPIVDVETYLSPGSGSQVIFAEVNHIPCKTQRALAEELARASEIIQACPSLCENVEGEGFLWSLPEPLHCLELLTEANAVRDLVDVHWPQGERFRLAAVASSANMQLRVSTNKDWFQLTGELTVGEGEVLQLQELIELLEKDDSLGRFVKLRDGQFLALTREFRQRLAEVDAFTTSEKNGARRLSPLAAHALVDFTEEAQTKLNKKWIAHVERLRNAGDHLAQVPSTLQAELRPYQLEGFHWLARQAEWGVGACLADDMGLGKTIQALALLLHRAQLGPALVIAPTSVTRNWLSEAMKFAPTLRPRLFGPGDRAASLADLQAFDVVLCTYGLLAIEIEALEKVPWSTIVLDEAQSIKNASTQRWKSAMRLQGEFKVITTGTPIENQLAELHALFQFINPGLLGSAQRFHVKFADPIGKLRDEGARQRLKRLIRPFILRRMKNQVLQDLPSRTDIVLRVEPSTEETAFYEALRRKALQNLAKGKSDSANAGERSLRILAEIMKLRRACCHPKLVDAKIPLESSKLELFGETIDEVLANGHKALVFSQFVDHLGFIRDHLEKKGIRYQYLDGQTPAKKRQAAVNAFQGGEGDVFLISLRAGGTGLNLTAADYVIHMDPWWNPAVEDQASDRAHRIGQQRPVTVYRLVVANTIEEKIVELHHQKRDLADSLLSGAETAGKLSAEQLLSLLQDER